MELHWLLGCALLWQICVLLATFLPSIVRSTSHYLHEGDPWWCNCLLLMVLFLHDFDQVRVVKVLFG